MATQPPLTPNRIEPHSPAETPLEASEPVEPRPDEILSPVPDIAEPGSHPEEWPGEAQIDL